MKTIRVLGERINSCHLCFSFFPILPFLSLQDASERIAFPLSGHVTGTGHKVGLRCALRN